MAAVVAAVLTSEAAAQPANPWRSALLADAQALHDTFLDSHPGAVDRENPGFRRALAAGLAQARERARTVDSFGGYRWALREYAAAFDDGHVSVRETEKAPNVSVQWPGFLTRERGGRQVVAARGAGASAPPLGAVLASCDGRSAAELVKDDVGRFRGRWNLESQREAHSWRLFIDAGNPFITRPVACVFEQEGRTRTYPLVWTSLLDDALQAETKQVSATFRTGVGLRPFRERGLWLSAGTFSAGSGEGAKLEDLAKQLTRDGAALRAAEVIVLDVRGNSGGSSEWGRRIASALWGETNAAAATPRSGGVDWRASEANIAEMQAMVAKGGGLLMRAWAGNAIAGMRKARAAGQPLWRETAPLGGLFSGGREGRASAIDPSKFVTRARVYVLTDAACASACLDALDVWKTLGAIHVGRETSADSLYMEVRDQVLPSGYAQVSVPMKVYRGRVRGLNEPHRPVHRLDVDMADTEALEAAIASLASIRRGPQPPSS